jgi:riboflavin-specific deaminase-like protein
VTKIPIDAWLSKAENHRILTGHPFITLSWAQSLDGSISTRRGQALNISGPESMRMTHRLRAAHDAIAVGIGTVLSDDPQLTVRLVDGKNPQPVILDTHLSFPEQAHLLAGSPSPWIATVMPAHSDKGITLQSRGAQVLSLPAEPSGRVDLYALLTLLASNNINSILVEGGARLITSFLRCQLVDWVVITISPSLVGGVKVVEDLLSPIPRLKETDSTRLGEDLIVWGAPVW